MKLECKTNRNDHKIAESFLIIWLDSEDSNTKISPDNADLGVCSEIKILVQKGN